MATLSGNVDATVALWTVSADVPDTTDYLQVDSEIVRVRSQFPGVTLRGNGEVFPSKIRVERAAGGTTAASHLSGATLTPVIPPASGGGGGGVTVDNQSDPPAEITTIVAPAATISGDEATIPVQNIINLEATGENDAGFEYSAQVEDGTASFEVDCSSENSQGAINLAATGGSKSAIIDMTASDGGGARISVSAEELGFFDAAAAPRPQVPASPTEQDIVDALVLLGLITQSA